MVIGGRRDIQVQDQTGLGFDGRKLEEFYLGSSSKIIADGGRELRGNGEGNGGVRDLRRRTGMACVENRKQKDT